MSLGAGEISLLTVMLIQIVSALGIYLPMSVGQLDMGLPGYVVIGAYTTALLVMRWHVPMVLALLCGGVGAMIFSTLINILGTRVRLAGFALAIFSLGWSQALSAAMQSWNAIGGAQGLVGIPIKTNVGIAAAVLVVFLAVISLFDRGSLGRQRITVRRDPVLAEAIGVNVRRRLIAYAVCGAFVAGVSGGLTALYVSFVQPQQFGFAFLVTALLPIVLGGVGTVWGPVVGVVVFTLIPQFVSGLQNSSLIVSSIVTIVVITFRPDGLITRSMVRRFSTVGRRDRDLMSGLDHVASPHSVPATVAASSNSDTETEQSHG